MTTEEVRDYLQRQLFIENSVVSYRLLSRELGIHVNDARLELQKYRSQRKDVHATYMMIGTPPPRDRYQKAPPMDVDGESDEPWDVRGGEDVEERLMLLVSEDELEDSKSQFYIIDAIDVYSLSAVYLIDADLACKEQDRVREFDANDKTGELAKKVGRIIGPNVKKRKPLKRNLKGKGKLGAASITSKQPTIKKDPTVKKDTTIKKDATVKAEPAKTSKEPTKEKSSLLVEKKPTKAGTLDWSKAKSKVEKEKEKADELKARAEKEAREAKAKREKDREEKEKEKEKEKPNPKPLEEKPTAAIKRGVKRKTGVLDASDSEQSAKPPSPEPLRGARLKGRIIVSDDEESDEPKPRKGKGKASAQSSDVEELERSVRAMMDIDDEEVEKVTIPAPAKPIQKSKLKIVVSSDEEERAEPADAEDSMYVDDEPTEVKPKRPRKKVEKKVVPVGRNGLKKKRVVKSRMSVDAKGYMVTEDYSSYESVDEEEPDEPEKPKKKLTSKASESKLKRSASSKSTKAPPKEVKKRASMGGGSSSKNNQGQSNLMNFFGKKP